MMQIKKEMEREHLIGEEKGTAPSKQERMNKLLFPSPHKASSRCFIHFMAIHTCTYRLPRVQ